MAKDNGAIGGKAVPLTEIKPDGKNPNQHSERGVYMLRRSMERFGFLEPGVLDANNRIIGGNSRTETAVDVLDADEAIVIDIDGKRPVFVRRADLDLETAEGREASIALNRSAEVGITWDVGVLADFAADGLDLGEWWQDFELTDLGLAAVNGAEEADAEPQKWDEQYAILIELNDESEQVAALQTLTDMGYKCRALIS
jgi:hypothetical protein